MPKVLNRLRLLTLMVLSLLLAGCLETSFFFNDRENPRAETLKALSLSALNSDQQSVILAKGDSLSIRTEAEYSDGSTSNVSNRAVFFSTDESIAVIEDGLLIGLNTGTTTLIANYEDKSSNELLVTVTPAYLTSISLTVADEQVALGRSTAFTAVGIYNDGSQSDVTNSAIWNVVNPGVASVIAGSVTTVSIGTTSVSAQWDGISSNSVDVTVTAPELDSIAVSPSSVTIDFNDTQVYTANGTYSDGNVVDISGSVSWSSSDTDLSTFSSATATGVGAGSVTITASLDGVSNTATLTINSFPLCGGAVDDTDRTNANGACIKVIDYQGTGQLFTGTPSEAAVTALGYSLSANNSNTGRTYSDVDYDGFVGGNFALFRKAGSGWDSDINSPTYGLGGQYDRYCAHLADIRFSNRANWRATTLSELDAIYANLGNMFYAYGWAKDMPYATSNGFSSTAYYLHRLDSNTQFAFSIAYEASASCTSEP